MFLGAKRKKNTAEMVRRIMISNWMDVFGNPGIMAAAKDSRFIGQAR